LLAAQGAALIASALAGLADGSIAPMPQPEQGVTYAAKIDKAEARIDWSGDADELRRRINGLSPFPGAWCDFAGERLKLLKAEPAAGSGPAGTLLDDTGVIACGTGALRLLTVQRAGKGPVAWADFNNGARLAAGDRLA